jgi:protein O-mannosyl-transferase
MRPSQDEPKPRANSYYVWGVCAFLLLAIGLIYGQTLGHALLDYDDNTFVYGNSHVTPGLTGEGFRWAFTDGPGGEWYPLSMLSHMLDCQIFGVEPWGHHLVNVLLHAATSIALLLVLWRMTGELWPSAFVAVVFAVHPQHVESVAWVAERKDVLSGLFFVLTLGAYLGYVRHGRSLGGYFLVAALFALGLLAKPMIVTLPPLLLLLDFWPLASYGSATDTPTWTASVRRPGTLRLLLEKLPLLALSAGDCLMTLRTHTSGGVNLPWLVRIGNAAVSCVKYVVQLFYPIDLAAFYPIAQSGPPAWKVAAAIAILAAVSTAAVFWRRRSPYVFVGWFWYLGMLFPVSGLVSVAWFSMADRYMYLPGIGLYIALAWGATRLVARSSEGRWALGACGTLAIAVLMACAAWQTSLWRDDETLWRHALECTTDNGEAEVGLADALVRRGQLDAAIPYFRQAIQHAVDYTPFNNLGLVMAKQDKASEAIALFRRAVEIEPQAFNPHVNLGLAMAVTNQFAEAHRQFDLALEINPRGVDAHRALAYLLTTEGKFDQARAQLDRAIESDPRNPTGHVDLAMLLMRQGQSAAAKSHFEAALMLDPKNPQALRGLDKLRAAGVNQPAP